MNILFPKECATKRHLRLIAPALGIVVVVATLAGCQLFSKPFEVSVTLSSKQYAGAQNADGSYTLYFPNVSAYNTALPNGGENRECALLVDAR